MTQQIIPAQKKGAKSDSSYHKSTRSESEAGKLFQQARLNLLNVNNWHMLMGSGMRFQLVNNKGEDIHTPVTEDCYIRIRVAAIPHSDAGNGDEWVYVEKVQDTKLKHHESTAIRVRPAVPPFVDKKETAHFFADDATSSFTVERNNNKISAAVSGRNEVPNTATKSPFRWLRNVLVALGAMLGLNKPIWKKLAKGLIEKK